MPEVLAVYSLPEAHQRRMRTSNRIERSIQQDIKRRTVKVFPSGDSLLSFMSAILVAIDKQWAGQSKPYIKCEYQNA